MQGTSNKVEDNDVHSPGKMMSHMSLGIRLRNVSLMLQCFSVIGMDPDIVMAYPGQHHA